MAPVLGDHTVTDPHINSFSVTSAGRHCGYLQTSPEFALKKLLAKDVGAVYSLGPVFRAGESGGRHNEEFLMLEWYQPGFDLSALEDEIASLIKGLAIEFGAVFPQPHVTTYAELFSNKFSVNPHFASETTLRELVEAHFPESALHLDVDLATSNDYLDTLFSLGVELELQAPTFVREFPATQAALAKIATVDGVAVSMRSELYWQGLELCNAYDELRDGDELRQRMVNDNAIRDKLGYDQIAPDDELIGALAKMPECVGVALGVERLLMLLNDANELSEISEF